MNNSKNARFKRAGGNNHLLSASEHKGAVLYNNCDVQEVVMLANEDFAKRLYSLRSAKLVSAREMSLSLGQGNSYITNIENGKHLPSMKQFFSICEYLNITPAEFFEYSKSPNNLNAELFEIIQSVDKEDQELLISLAIKLSEKK